MAFDEQLAHAVRNQLKNEPGLAEKKMFGGLAFMIKGNMCVGVIGAELIVRLPVHETEAALEEPGVRRFDMTGRPMKGWLMVEGSTVGDATSLRRWLRRSVRYVAALPKK
jgi:hypothetical protein